jgi:hypothetical protein
MKKCAIKKGHHYIVSYQGPPEPTENTRAAPQTGHCPFVRLSVSKLAVLIRTPKSSVNFQTNYHVGRQASKKSFSFLLSILSV